MEKLLKVTGISVFILIHLLNSYYTECCNESVCGSIVSKCLLMQLCRCAPGNYTCNKECYYCLKDSYSECCSCVELCEIPDPYHSENIDSYIGVIDNSVPGLFQALSEEETDWTSETFQIQYHLNNKESTKMMNFHMDNDMNEILRNEEMECTVVYLKNCTSVSKCEKICASMGASGFRWFHDGCCECVGEKCFNFGLKESKCRYCSYDDEMDWDESEGIYHFSEDNELGDANDIVDMIW